MTQRTMDELLEAMKPSNEDAVARAAAWAELFEVYTQPECHAALCPNTLYCIDHGLLDTIHDQLSDAEQRDLDWGSPCMLAITIFSWIALHPLAAQHVATSGVVAPLVVLVTQRPCDVLGCFALRCLGNMALHEENRAALAACNVLRLALLRLPLLAATEDDFGVMDYGLAAASVLIRLVGRDEAGKGFEAIQGNVQLLHATKLLLDKVIEAGEDSMVYEAYRDPANIVLDISLLATSDGNKPLVGELFIPALLQAMRARPDNARLQKYAVVALSQLVFHQPSRHTLCVQHEQQVLDCLAHVIASTRRVDDETYRTACVLRSTVELGVDAPQPLPQEVVAAARKPSMVGALLLRRASTTAPPPRAVGHVMISYNWKSQAIAVALQARLAQAGVKTWFDVHDMGSNINDSMAEAVEGARHVVVLFSRQYKESGNCRKELELADHLAKPCTFVKVQADYKQEGWLALVMGRALWVPCFDVDAVDAAFDQLARRLKL